MYYQVTAANNVTYTGSAKVTVSRASMNKSDLTAAQKPTAANPTWTGKAQTLVKAPDALPDGYTKLQYSTDGGRTWSDAIPTGTDVGSTTINVKYVGDKNHIDFTGYPVVSAVKKARAATIPLNIPAQS